MSATSITVRVPLTIRNRGGRKIAVAPDGSVIPNATRQTTMPSYPALLKALARAFRYQRLLDERRYASISEMAVVEKLDRGYLGRLLQLTLLAPAVVQAIMDGRQPIGVTLPVLLEPFPVEWGEQRAILAGTWADGCAPWASGRSY